MNALRKNVYGIVAVVFAGVAGFVGPVSAAEETAPEGVVSDSPSYQEKVARLKQLKAENPAEFERVVRERKEKIKERLQELKKTDPEKFKEVKQKMAHHHRERLAKLREENPEKFRRVMEKRKDRLETARDRREDIWDARHDGGRRDRLEDIVDRREDRFDRREAHRDQGLHRGDERGVRDHGLGVGRGDGQGYKNRKAARAASNRY